MPQTTVTSSFNRYKAQEAAGGRRVVLDEFVFASIPGLDASKLPGDSEGLPDAKYIVHRQTVDKGGMVNADTVVYTVTLPTTAGDFTFNWMALINRESGTPAVITYLYPQQKIKNTDGVQGNVLTYSEYMRYTGASTLTGITTPASTWQIDFTARLHGMDEDTRKVALDLYGNALFFGDGFKLTATDTPGLAELAPGTAYLRGLRTELTTGATLTFETGKEQTISLDSALTGALTGENRTTFTLISHETADYTDALGFRHYVEPVARIAPDGTITDLRAVGHKVRDALAGEFLEKSKNLAEIAAAGETAQKEAREHLALGKLATLDSVSTEDTTAMKKAANGSDIESVAMFRRNLELGDSATRNVGKLPGTVAAGDDSRITGAMQKDQNGADIPDKPLFVRTLGIVDAYPAGCPIPYPGPIAPDGYLLLAGRAFSKTLYPQLAKLYPDGVLPDMRGMYVRGWDNGRNLDRGVNISSFQNAPQNNSPSQRGLLVGRGGSTYTYKYLYPSFNGKYAELYADTPVYYSPRGYECKIIWGAPSSIGGRYTPITLKEGARGLLSEQYFESAFAKGVVEQISGSSYAMKALGNIYYTSLTASSNADTLKSNELAVGPGLNNVYGYGFATNFNSASLSDAGVIPTGVPNTTFNYITKAA